MFYGFYHGRSPLNNHLGEYVLSSFPSTEQADLRRSEFQNPRNRREAGYPESNEDRLWRDGRLSLYVIIVRIIITDDDNDNNYYYYY